MNALGFRHIRVRLAVLNLVVFGGILVLYAFGTSWFFLSTLNHQMDGSLKEEVELVEQMLLHSPDGSYPPDIHDENIHELERFLEIWSFDGRLLYRSKALGANALGGMPDTTRLHSIVVTRSQLLSDGTRMRVAEKQHTGSSPRIIRLAVSEAGYLADIQKLVTVLLIGTPVALLLVLVCAYLMAHRALKPIDLMASTARRMGTDNLAGRIPITNPDDELGRLAAAFNELLSRVERSFVQLRQFTSDASHELRTPLTAMRTVGEVGLQVGRTASEYREVIGSMLEESNRLTKLVDSLLFLARADSGKHQLHKENLDLFTFAR